MLDIETKKLIEGNLDIVRRNLAPYKGVSVLGAVKTVDTERICFAAECGLDIIGENRVNELTEKYGHYPETARLDFIGTLQRNKVKYLIGKVALIHSADSPELIAEIGRQAVKHGTSADILVEVNIGNEESKSGVCAEKVWETVLEARKTEGVRVRGLMTIPPVCADARQADKYFSEMREIFEKINQNILDISAKNVDNSTMDILSMGMSNDYERAAANGATLVRLGTAIFGERNYHKQ